MEEQKKIDCLLLGVAVFLVVAVVVVFGPWELKPKYRMVLHGIAAFYRWVLYRSSTVPLPLRSFPCCVWTDNRVITYGYFQVLCATTETLVCELYYRFRTHAQVLYFAHL